MIAQWDILKDPCNAILKDLYTKWRSLLAQDTTLPTIHIPDPEKLVNMYYNKVFVLLCNTYNYFLTTIRFKFLWLNIFHVFCELHRNDKNICLKKFLTAALSTGHGTSKSQLIMNHKNKRS